jgi:hypothetical protein
VVVKGHHAVLGAHEERVSLADAAEEQPTPVADDADDHRRHAQHQRHAGGEGEQAGAQTAGGAGHRGR